MQEHNEIEQTWDSYSDEHFGKLDYAEIFKEIGKDPYRGFPKAVAELLAEYFPDLRGKKVCVPSCGDCVAAFAFAKWERRFLLRISPADRLRMREKERKVKIIISNFYIVTA